MSADLTVQLNTDSPTYRAYGTEVWRDNVHVSTHATRFGAFARVHAELARDAAQWAEDWPVDAALYRTLSEAYYRVADSYINCGVTA